MWRSRSCSLIRHFIGATQRICVWIYLGMCFLVRKPIIFYLLAYASTSIVYSLQKGIYLYFNILYLYNSYLRYICCCINIFLYICMADICTIFFTPVTIRISYELIIYIYSYIIYISIYSYDRYLYNLCIAHLLLIIKTYDI